MNRSNLPGSDVVTISEFRCGIKEIINRVERGGGIVIARGERPVAMLVPVSSNRPRRLGLLREMMSTEQIAELTHVMDAPLSATDQAAFEGGLTDEFGIAKH